MGASFSYNRRDRDAQRQQQHEREREREEEDRLWEEAVRSTLLDRWRKFARQQGSQVPRNLTNEELSALLREARQREDGRLREDQARQQVDRWLAESDAY